MLRNFRGRCRSRAWCAVPVVGNGKGRAGGGGSYLVLNAGGPDSLTIDA
jgi:hypothetical protein